MLGGTMGPALLGHGVAPIAAEAAAAAGVGGLGAAGLYSPLGQNLTAHLLASRPDLAAPLAAAIRRSAPLAVAASPYATGLGP